MGQPNRDEVRKRLEAECQALRGQLAFRESRALCPHDTWVKKYASGTQVVVWECQQCKCAVDANDPICQS